MGSMSNEEIAIVKVSAQHMSIANDDTYWLQYLANAPVTRLTQFDQDPSPPHHTLITAFRSLSDDTLNDFSATHNATLVNICQTAWALVLRQYTNTTDLAFHYSLHYRRNASGREYDSTASTKHIQPLILRLRSLATIADVVKQVRNDTLEQCLHASERPHSRDGAASQQFGNTILHFDRDIACEVHEQSADQESELEVTTQYDFSIDIKKEQAGIRFTLHYRTALADDTYCDNLLQSFGDAIDFTIHHASQSWTTFLGLTTAQKEVLIKVNGAVPSPQSLTVDQLVQSTVRKLPAAQAIDAWDGKLTYEELDSLSRRLASYLGHQGIRRGPRVGICMDKGAWTIISMLAILRIGGTIVPLGTHYPVLRLQNILQHSELDLILVDEAQAARLDALEVTKAIIDPAVIRRQPELADHAHVSPTTTAWIMYTSGTTAAPKGIVLEHQNIATAVSVLAKDFQLEPGTRTFQYSALTFDASISDIFATLTAGGCVCVPSEADRLDDCTAAMADLNVTFALLTPTVAAMVDPAEVPSMQHLSLIGEPASAALIERWLEHTRITNAYGPTECSIAGSVGRIEDRDQCCRIGAPTAACYWVVDPSNHKRLVPPGVLGELLIDGPLVGRCYLKDPVQTAHLFIQDPDFLRDLGLHYTSRRMYRTGDLVRQNNDGSLTYIGRHDTMIKVGGQRLDISEIENAILDYLAEETKELSLACVEYIAPKGPKTSRMLVAAIELYPDDSAVAMQILTASEALSALMDGLKTALSQKLVRFMIPTFLVPVERLPLNGSGKLDRRTVRTALESMTTEQLAVFSRRVSKSLTKTEEILREIWSEILDRPLHSIKTSDSFLLLGGDSLSAMRLGSEARKKGLRISVADILKYPVLASMASAVDNHDRNALQLAKEDPRPFELFEGYEADSLDVQISRLTEAAIACGVNLDDIEDIYPCTTLQAGLMAISSQRSGAYSFQLKFAIEPEVDLSRLRDALDTVVDELAIMRTRIVPLGTSTYQIVLKNGPEVLDAADLAKYLAKDLSTRFTHGRPLHRIAIAEPDDAGHRHLIWTAQHSAYDGWTIVKILSLLVATYKGQRLPPAVPIPRFIQYIQDTTERSTACLDYWQSQLDGVAPITWPMLPSPSYRPQPRSKVSHKINLSKHGKRFPASVILRAAWAVVVSTYTQNSAEATINVTLSGREIPVLDIEEIVAPAITTVPVRIKLNPWQTVTSLLAAVHDQIKTMAPYTHWGLHDIRNAVSSLSSDFDPGHLFIVQPGLYDRMDRLMQSIGLRRLNSDDSAIFDDYALTVECIVSPDTEEVELLIRYDETVVSTPVADSILATFVTVCEQFESHNPSNDESEMAYNNATLGSIDLVSHDTLAVIRTWNSVEPKSRSVCMHDLVREATSRTPDALAVDAWDGCLTFQQLTDYADHLAHQLQSLGVELETKVGLCLGKSMWAPVAMLAILIAGGAVVPLGTQHPVSRIATITADCSMSIAIVDRLQSQRLKALIPHCLEVDVTMMEDLHHKSTTPCQSTVAPHNACWVCYTSGSTGTPKGVVMEHAAYSTSITAQADRDGFSSTTRTLQFADHTYDAVLEETFATWIAGGCTCIPSEAQRLNDLPDFLRSMRITFIAVTPTVANLFGPEDVPTLEVITFGGEKVRASDVRPWLEQEHLRLMNSYGPTECSVIASQSYEIASAKDASNIGYPLASRFWITDTKDYNRLCPLGVAGELLVEGPVLAREYLNDKNKTASSFIVNPSFIHDAAFSDLDLLNKRMYRTGDLVCQNGDGSFTHLGRIDAQMKIRGQRVEAGEIESKLLELVPNSRHAFVDLVKPNDFAGDQILLALVDLPGSSDDSGRPTAATIDLIQGLHDSLHELLPAFSVPRHIIPVASLPMGGSGKLDRRAARRILETLTFAEMKLFDKQSTREDDRRLTSTEEELRSLWSQVLGRREDEIGLHDHFRHLGGDSIIAIRLVAQARKKNIHLSVGDVVRHPRLYDQAKAIDNHTVAAERASTKDPKAFQLCPEPECDTESKTLRYIGHLAELCSTSTSAVEDAYPCTPLQEGLMAMTAMQPRAYSARYIYRATATFNLDGFRHALEALFKTLPLMRTRIVVAKTVSMQVVINEDLEWYEASSLTSYLSEDRDTPFDYGAPLHRFAIITQAAADKADPLGSPEDQPGTYVVWSAHHSAYDGVSMFRMMQMLVSGYLDRPQLLMNGIAPTPRFIEYVQEARSEQQRDRVAAYWRSQLSGASLAQFPQLPHPQYRPIAKASLQRQIAGSKYDKLVSTSSLLRAAWAIVVGAYTSSEDVVLAVALSGRDIPVTDIEEVIAPTLATVPISIHLNLALPVPDYLKLIERQSDEMVPFLHTGIQTIRAVSGLGAALEPGHLFIIQPALEEHFEELVTELDLERLPVSLAEFMGYALIVSCIVDADSGSTTLDLRYDEDVLPTSLAEPMIDLFQHIVTQLESCNRAGSSSHQHLDHSSSLTLGQLSMTSPRQAELLTAHVAPHQIATTELIQEVISKKCMTDPQRQSVCSWDGCLTYGELRSYACQLAASLLPSNNGLTVGICMSRSRWSVVALLAVLEAGAVAVPLDIDMSDDTLTTILSTAGVRTTLVDTTQAKRLQGITSCRVVDETSMKSLSPKSATQSTATMDNVAWITHYGQANDISGAAFTHKAIFASLKAQVARLSLQQMTRVLHFASYTSSRIILEVLGTWMAGGCVCIPSETVAAQDLAMFMKQSQVNFALLPPAVVAAMEPTELPGMRTLVVDGPTTKLETEKWLTAKIDVLGAYGPEECSVIAYHQPEEQATIGMPLYGRYWISTLGDPHRLAAPGAPGELLIQSSALCENDTRSLMFVDTPLFLQQLHLHQERRVLRTGDLVKQHYPGGPITYLGKIKEQVKKHGQRIDVGYFERCIIEAHQDIHRACVDVHETAGGSDKSSLVALVEVKSVLSQAISSSSTKLLDRTPQLVEMVMTIHDSLARTMTRSMLPDYFVAVDRLPLTRLGAVDRPAVRIMLNSVSPHDLKSLKQSRIEHASVELSLTAVKMRTAWALVLQMPESEIHSSDQFDQLGGDSVLAIQLVMVARKMEMHFGVADVLRTPRLTDLAKLADGYVYAKANAVESDARPFELWQDRDQHTGDVKVDASLRSVADTCSIDAARIEDVYPCTPLQEALMAITARQSNAYLAQFVFKLTPKLDVARFKHAWSRLYALLPILRTRIVYTDQSRPLQIVPQAAQLSWADATNLNEYLADDQAQSMSYGDPLFRFALVDECVSSTPESSRYFVLTAHHSAYDGWVVLRLFKMLMTLYHGHECEAGPPVTRMLRYLAKIDANKEKQYWNQQLSGMQKIQFPTLPHPAYQPRLQSGLDREVHLSDQHSKVPLAILLRAAWAMVVSVGSGADEITLTVALAGRDLPVLDLENIVAPTLTVVPVRISRNRQLKVSEYLEAVKQQQQDMIPYAHTGLHYISKLVSDFDPIMSSGSLFVVQPALNRSDEFRQLRDIGLVAVETEQEAFGDYALIMACEASTSSPSATMHMRFDEQVLSTSASQSLLDLFENLLRQMHAVSCGGRDTLLGQLDLLNEADKAQLRSRNLNVSPARRHCIHEVVKDMAAKRADALAVVAWDGTYTYDELESRAERLAQHLLLNAPQSAGKAIGLCMAKSRCVPAAMLAILKSGNAILPLGMNQPDARIRTILEASRTSVVLTDSQTVSRLSALDMALHLISIDDNMLNDMPPGDSCSSVSPDDLACILATSGSTGVPKCLLLEHKTLCTTLLAYARHTEQSTSSRVLQFSAHTFDSTISEVFTTLMAGAVICIPSEQQRLDIDQLSAFVRTTACTHTFMTPSMASVLVPAQVPSLQHLAVGGEALRPDVIERWQHICLVSVYGPAECSIYTTITPPLRSTAKVLNLGQAMVANLWVVDPADSNCLVGFEAPGELLIEGPLLSRGYLNDEARTDASFVEDCTFVGAVGLQRKSRMYKTGDIVQQHRDGTISWVGRRDTQVKIRGQRIEIGELESQARHVQSVSDVAIILPKEGPFANQLVGFITLEEGSTGSRDTSCITVIEDMSASLITEMSAYLSQNVMHYAIPRVWIQLSVLPLNASAKTDRKLLEDWVSELDQEAAARYRDASAESQEDDDEVPITPMQERLQLICAEVLNRPISQISRTRSFLAMGGDSVSAMKFAAACRRQGLVISMPDMLKARNLVELALLVKVGSQSNYGDLARVPAKPFVLSPLQRFYSEQLGEPHMHNNAWVFDQTATFSISVVFSVDQISEAITAVVQKHSMLRVRFAHVGELDWRQQIERNVHDAYRLEVHEVTSVEEAKQIAAATRSWLDLRQGPVLAVKIFIHGQKRFIHMMSHHLVVDLVSWRVVQRDLQMMLLQHNISADETVSYPAWCELVHQRPAEKVVDDHRVSVQPLMASLDYWDISTSQLEQLERLHTTAILSKQTMALIHGSSNEVLHTEPVDILLAALLMSFNQVFIDRDTPVIFNEDHGRRCWDSDLDLSDTIGPFATYTPLSIGKDDDDMTAVLSTVKRQRENAHLYRSSHPMDCFISGEESGVRTKPTHPEIVFSYLGRLMQLNDVAGWCDFDRTIAGEGASSSTASVLSITVAYIGDQGEVTLTYSKHSKHQSRLHSWLDTFVQTTSKFANDLVMRSPVTLPQAELVKSGVTDTQMLFLESHVLSPQLDMTYFAMDAIDPETPLDVPRMSQACFALIAHHDAFRLCFAKDDGIWKQSVWSWFRPEISVYTINTTFDAWTQSFIQQRTFGPLVQNEPPVKIAFVLNKHNASHRILFRLSHAVYDGISMPIIWTSLLQIYHSMPLRKPASYLDYVRAVKQCDDKAAVRYWTDLLKGSTIPSLTPEPAIADFSNPWKGKDVGTTTFEVKLLDGITTSMLLKAAWAFVLAQFTGTNDVLFGDTVSGRVSVDPSLTDVVGCCINGIPVRIKLEESWTFKDLMYAVQRQQLASMPHETFGATRILLECTNWRPTSVMTSSFINAPTGVDTTVEMGSNNYTTTLPPQPVLDYTIGLIRITWFQTEEKVAFTMRYAVDHISEKMAAALFEAYKQVCQMMIEAPETRLSDAA